MALLRKAAVEQSAAKVGLFGVHGAGKTTTAMLIALGLSKTFHNSAPVAIMDTENGSDYFEPIFEAEGVPLHVAKTRAFLDMKNFLREAEEEGCCTSVVDSYSAPWAELNDTLKALLKIQKLDFHHKEQLHSLWRVWVDQMLNSPLHVILSGRLGYVWDHETEENGQRGDLVKLGTKMKSESEAGYEPSLLIELEAVQKESARLVKSRAKQGSISHHAYVVKDRWRTLNGRTFTWKDLNGYKPGDYKRVFDAFRPHFDCLAIGKAPQRAVDASRTSAALFDGRGDSLYHQRARRVQIVLEEWDGTLRKLWPGETGKEKAMRVLMLESIFGTHSRTRVEEKSLEDLEAGLVLLQKFEDGTQDVVDALSNTPDAVALLGSCRDLIKAEKVAAELAAVM